MKRKHVYFPAACGDMVCVHCGVGQGGTYDDGTECKLGPYKEDFSMRLFDDASTREKLKVMTPIEALFDDERSEIPDGYYDIVQGLKPGQKLRIIVEIIEEECLRFGLGIACGCGQCYRSQKKLEQEY